MPQTRSPKRKVPRSSTTRRRSSSDVLERINRITSSESSTKKQTEKVIRDIDELRSDIEKTFG